jgi:hypothetical protein
MMSIVGGLVHRHSEKDLVGSYRHADWFDRNAWAFVVAGSLAVWAFVAWVIYAD